MVGKVLPATLDSMHICVELDDGTIIEEKEKIANLFFPNLENGIVVPEDKAKMLEIVGRYVRETSADAVLLGCTELPLMIKDGDIDVPLLNTTQIHINAIFDAAK